MIHVKTLVRERGIWFQFSPDKRLCAEDVVHVMFIVQAHTDI